MKICNYLISSCVTFVCYIECCAYDLYRVLMVSPVAVHVSQSQPQYSEFISDLNYRYLTYYSAGVFSSLELFFFPYRLFSAPINMK